MTSLQNHESDAERQQAEIYRSMTPAQKWAEAWKLRKFAWAVKRAALRAQHPEWSEEQVDQAVKEIFLYASS